MQRLTRFALDRPFLVSALILLATLGLAAQLPKLSSETGYRAYLGAEHPTVQTLDGFIESFGGGLPMAAVWSCEDTDLCETVFDDAALEMASTVVGVLRGRGGVRGVESPATSTVVLVRGDTLDARSLDGEGQSQRDRDELIHRARMDPIWRGALVSEDGRAGAIVVELASSESEVTAAVLEELEDALAPLEAQGFRFHIVGQTAQFALTDEALAADSQRLTPVMITLVAIVMFVLFRSWQSVAAALATVGLASLWTVGMQALLGWPQNSITQTIAPLILVVALCDSIHLLSRYAQRRTASAARSREERAASLLRAVADAGAACLATTVSTVAAFLSFSTSGLESLVRFGVLSGSGIAAALLLTFTALPILIVWLPPERIRAARASEAWDRALASLVAGTRRRARAILVGSVLLGAVCAYGAWELEVDVDEYELYGEESSVVRGFRFLEEHLRKPDSLEIELAIPEGRELHEADVLGGIERLARRLESIDGLGPVRSILDPISWTHRLLSEDDPRAQRLGDTAGQNAELLTMLEFADPGGLDRWMTPSHRNVRLSVEAEKLPRSARGGVLREVHEAIEGELGDGWRPILTGSFVVYHDLTTEIQRTQLFSFGAAAVVVFLVLAGFLASIAGGVRAALGWAAVGMFPTILPVFVIFGVMGYAGISLDMGTAMVAAIIIGIGVDDTIHLMGEFFRRRRVGVSAAAAMEGAVLQVGQAVVTTSIALTMGFFVLLLSSWQSISSFGFLSGIAILGALAADLWVLPALVLVVTRQRGGRLRDSYPRTETAPPRSHRAIMTLLALLPVAGVAGLAAKASRENGV